MNGVREMRAPKHFLPELLSKMIVCSLDSSDEDKEHVSILFHALRTEGLITGDNFIQVWFLWTSHHVILSVFGLPYILTLAFAYITTGFPYRFGPVSKARGRHSPGEVLSGPVCCTRHHRWPHEHHRLGPSSGERYTLPSLFALPATNGQAKG